MARKGTTFTSSVLAIALILGLTLRLGGATLFQNFARDMARNQVLHILRHHPDLIYEIIQQQQQQQQQQMGFQNSLNGNGNINGNLPQQQQQNGNLMGNLQQQGFGGGGASVMSSQAGRPALLPADNSRPLTLDELVRQTNRFPNQRFEV